MKISQQAQRFGGVNFNNAERLDEPMNSEPNFANILVGKCAAEYMSLKE